MKRAVIIIGALLLAVILMFGMTRSAEAHRDTRGAFYTGPQHQNLQQGADPTMAIAPEAGPAGTQLWVLATGFPPHSGVNLGITPAPFLNDNFVTSARSDKNGTINAFLIVPDNVFLGEQWYIIAATPDNTIRKVSAPFTISDATAPITTPALGFVIDNTDGPTTEGGFPGGWNVITGSGYGGQYQWTSNSESRADRYEYFRWKTEGMTPGNYEVFVYIPTAGASTRHAPYWVHSSRGYTAVIVDQAANQGKWVSLGTYYFGQESNMDLFVSLSDVTGEPLGSTQVAVDAVLYVPR